VGWSIAEVSRMSGVTSRTLRHYDAIGLLSPAWLGAGGRRYYDTPELLRLQQILLLRELGLGLDAVADLLARSGTHDAVEVLRSHHLRLLAERDRLDRLAATVAQTITDMEGGNEMTAEAMFEGFRHNPYEAEARERWGDDVVDESNRRTAALTNADAARISETFTRVHTGLAGLRDAGVDVADDRVQELIAEHYQLMCTFWTPNAAAYTGLGQMYVDDERFRRNIGQGDDSLVEYLRDAMAVYAESSLS
jgi:DNA-binding transcriptional MerR regulator